MSEFNTFKTLFQANMDRIIQDGRTLFLTNVDKDEFWEHYLHSFPEGTNPIYEERMEYDCNHCKNFIKRYGSTVYIDDSNQIHSVWEFNVDNFFQEVCKKMDEYVKSFPIKNKLLTDEKFAGVDHNIQLLENGKTIKWEHISCKLPINSRFHTEEIDSKLSILKDNKNVFKRSLDELTIDATETVLEIIDQGSLYRGDEFKDMLTTFLSFQKEYNTIDTKLKDNLCWKHTVKGGPVLKIRNTSIGTLLINLSEGMDLDTAVRKFEVVVASTNYKRPKPIFTEKMIDESQQTIKKLGYEDSLGRRFAQTSDISVNNVLFANRDVRKNMKTSVFDELKEEAQTQRPKFDKVEEVHITDFIEKILPNSKNVELCLENKHESNLMSLIAPTNVDAPSMFKWDNNFSWNYNGDITDSIKDSVKSRGGNVDGVLRFSIMWSEDNHTDDSDLDAHCIEPSGNEIYFSNKFNYNTTGQLDVDIQQPSGYNHKNIVENITWTNLHKMDEGVYTFFVNNFTLRGNQKGFKAEVEYNGQIHSFHYTKPLKHKEKVVVAKIKFSKTNGIEFIESLESSTTPKTVWNVKTNEFVKTSMIMYSPNHWDKQSVGNKHYFFMLDGCTNPNQPRGFFNEFLKEDLLKHKRVFEALGGKMKVEPSEHQLSGVGFSSTKRDSIIARVEGKFKRVIKINF